jgi:hypothetical protein
MEQFHVHDSRDRVSARDVAFDAGLLNIRRPPKRLDLEALEVARFLLCLVRVRRQLTSNDVLILEAVVAADGNQSEAARRLAPGRPSYRRYVSRRLEKFFDIVRRELRLRSDGPPGDPEPQ